MNKIEKELVYKEILTELYDIYLKNHEDSKIISRKELSKNILVSIAYRNLEAEEYLVFNNFGSTHHSIRITNRGIDFLKRISKEL